MAEKKYVIDINLSGNQLKESSFEKLAVAPVSPFIGQNYYDTVLKLNRTWDGTAWVSGGGGTQPDWNQTDNTAADYINNKPDVAGHFADTNNPHSVTKSQVGLGNADDTSDLNKPVSTATQTALNLKLDASAYVQHFKGVFLSLAALQVAYPTAIAGDYAQVDSGAASNLVTYAYDLQDGWVLSNADGSGASNTDQLPEGSTNLYFTNPRALAAAPAETLTTVGALINSATDKATPVDTDYIGLMDSAASNILKKLSWANVKATLKSYFDTVYGILVSREAMLDANKVFSTGKTEVYLSVVLTAARTLTLPAANAFPAGTELIFVDEIGGLTSVNTVTLTRAGSDLINGATTQVFDVAYGVYIIITDGISKWTLSNHVGHSTGSYVPTYTGFSADPTATAYWELNGKVCTVIMRPTANGTSNLASTTFTLPFASAYLMNMPCMVTDNGTVKNGRLDVAAGSNSAAVFSTIAGGAMASSGAKAIYLSLTYIIQ